MGLVASNCNTLNLNGRENTSFLINIVTRLLLRFYWLLQVKRGPSRAGIAKTGRQVACELMPSAETAARWRCVLLITTQQTPHYNSQFCVSINFWFYQEALKHL